MIVAVGTQYRPFTIGADGSFLVADILSPFGMSWIAPATAVNTLYSGNGGIPAGINRNVAIPATSSIRFTGSSVADQFKVTDTDINITTSNNKLNIQGALDVLSIGHDGGPGTFVIQRSIAGSQQLKFMPTCTAIASFEMGGAATTSARISTQSKPLTMNVAGTTFDAGDVTVNNTYKMRVATTNRALETKRFTNDIVELAYDDASAVDAIYGLGLSAGAGKGTRLLIGANAGARGEIDFFSTLGGRIQTGGGSIDLQVVGGGLTFNGAAVKGSIFAADGTVYKNFPVGTNDQVLTADSTAGSGIAWKSVSAIPTILTNLTTVQRTALVASAGQMVFDTTLNQFFGWNGSAWVILG
jgi:hypothetical protein